MLLSLRSLVTISAERGQILAILADGGGDKPGRIARLRAQRLLERLENNLPFTWHPTANVTVIIKDAQTSGTSIISFLIDVTIRGVTKSLSEWKEGAHNPPDWQIVDPRLFVDDPNGDVVIPLFRRGVQVGTRRGRDDFVAAMRKCFVDDFGEVIAAILRNGE